MKKLLFAAYTLDIGGTEKALVSLVNYMSKENDITLVLERKQGLFLNEIPKSVKIIEYKPSQNKIVVIRKAINLLKRIWFTLKYKNKFDFAASYTTDRVCSSFCARTASTNNALWIHSDYAEYLSKEEMIKFFEFVEYSKFSKYVFVSNKAREGFIEMFPEVGSKSLVINNLINYKEILEKTKELIGIERNGVYTFLNVGRHDEKSKRLNRLIDAASMLKEDGFKFRIIFVGDGPETEMYQSLIREKNLEDYILFVGGKKNPYPYFNISDSVILTSDYEGYPVVFVEAMILGKPIISTNVSDSKKDIDGKFGVVVGKASTDIYSAMKSFIENGYEIKESFIPEKFNEKIIEKINELICFK